MNTVNIAVEVTDDQCADIMCTALEGGIGYWCRAGEIAKVPYPDGDVGWCYFSFNAYDTEAFGDDDETYNSFDASFQFERVDYATIRKGIERILSGECKVRGAIRAQVLSVTSPEHTDIDAQGADCIVQAGLFGKLVYG